MYMRSKYFLSMIVLGGALFGALCAASLLWLTPLKWITVVEPTMHNVDPKEFWAAYQKDPSKYLFLDVRDAAVYSKAHAEGSINEPIANLYGDHGVLPKHGKTIVLICSSGRLAGVAYGYLEHEGFLNVLRIDGGLNHWVQEGLPTVGSVSAIPPHD